MKKQRYSSLGIEIDNLSHNLSIYLNINGQFYYLPIIRD